MEVIYGGGLLNAGSSLTMFAAPMKWLPHSRTTVDIDFSNVVTKETAEGYLSGIQGLKASCQALNLDVTLPKVERLIER